MVEGLEAHENRHHAIQLECVEDLKKALKAATARDADKLKEIIDELQTDCQKKQDAYDGRSGHGAKEGIVLDLDA